MKTYTSGEYRFVEGQLKRSKKLLAIRGLNTNHNHDLKNIFKGAAIRAAAVAGPFQEFYAALIAKGMKPSMARLPWHVRLRRSLCSFGRKEFVSTPNI